MYFNTDDKINIKTSNGNPSGSIVISRDSLLTGSYSQSSMVELSSVRNTAKENNHTVNQSARYHYSRLKHSVVGGGGEIRELFRGIKQSPSINNESILKYKRESSNSSDELDLWDEKQREDEVGDWITKMLNSGHVPHFGYTPSLKSQGVEENDYFQLSPLFSSKNYRAVRNYVLAMSRKKNNTSSVSEYERIIRSRDRQSMRFIIETFAVVYIVVCSLNDIVLRSLSEYILFTMVGTVVSILFDVDEIKHVVTSLFHASLPVFISDSLKRTNFIMRRLFEIIDDAFLWGHHFQGRILLWSDKGMLVKFRRHHKRLMTTNTERRQKRKLVRRIKEEQKRKIKRGEAFEPSEEEDMETEIRAKEKLEADFKEFAMKPPTYLSDKVVIRIDPDGPQRSYATRCHLESLQYCQQMILLERDRNEPTPLSSQPAESEKRGRSALVCSKEAIEVVDELLDAGPTIGFDHYQRRLSQLSDEDDRFPFSDMYSMSDDGLSSNYSSDNGDDDDDNATSEGSYTSDSSHRSMPWMVVGAKIGHKLLNARKLRRLTMSNPDAAQKLIPEEAKKLIDGISKDQSQESFQTPSKSKSQDEPGSIFLSDQYVPFSTSPSKSNEQLEIKRPVHRLWTSAGSAAKTPNTFGAVTLAMSPTDDQAVSCFVESYQEGTYSNDNTPSRRSILNGIKAPPPSPDIENSANQFSPPKRGSLSFMRHMPTSTQSGASMNCQNFGIADSTPRVTVTRLAPLEKGVKMAVPIFSLNHQSKAAITSGPCFYQMGTVISSRRIYVAPNNGFRPRKSNTNCLSIKVFLDKALLRGSKFVEMELRIMDEWNQVPRHSKFPLGSCVATAFGVGILVGWRVEDDIHMIRSLWKRSGSGSGVAFLRRDSLHGVVEAAVGFDVQTTNGSGRVLAYTRGGHNNLNGKYFVQLDGRLKNQVMEFHRCQILSCQGATFVPVTEHIRAAALYRLEILQYKAKLRENMLNSPSTFVRNKGMWRNFSEYVDLFATSFSKAIAEDPDFDAEFDKLFSHIINLLDGNKHGDDDFQSANSQHRIDGTVFSVSPHNAETNTKESDAKDGWNINDMIACLFGDTKKDETHSSVNNDTVLHAQAFDEAHESAMIFIRVLTRTVTVAQASVPDRPRLHMALAMIHEALLLVRQILRVQQKNTSKKLIEAWFRALNEISNTFGPLKQRAAALGVQIAKKFKKHDSIAKRRILRFVDIVLGDTQLLHALELVNWRQALSRLEVAVVKSGIIDDATCEQLHRGVLTVYKNLAPRKKDRKSKAAAARNGQKINNLAKFIKIVASPGRSFLRLLTTDEVLVLFDRVLMRIFEKDPHYSMVINIYAFNFESIRHLRTLNNLSIAGKLWETVLDALDEEATFAMAEIPEQTKYFVAPFVKLFSLGVSHFHIRQSGGSNADWLDFLMEDEAVKIIQELDYKLIDSLEALCNDMKQVVQVLPYIKTIDDDILNLIDEFDFDLFLKEISSVIGHSEKWLSYITERSAVMVERFLDYLPRMSIPIERRELQDGWVLTCRSKDGGDLRLSDLSVLRENMLLSVFGSDNVFHPSSEPYKYMGSPKNNGITLSVSSDLTDDTGGVEESVLYEVRELILSAKMYGAWTAGIGGLKMSHHNERLPRELKGLPMSDKLLAQIDLWQALEVSDFDLLETAIREVSLQIQLQKEREEGGETPQSNTKNAPKLFNPRLDPTVLFLDIQNLTLRLEDFSFRVEKGKPMTIFDPVFEGRAGIIVKNVSITLKVKVEKERRLRDGVEISRPVLQLSVFNVKLEKLKLKFMQTGADWILNAVLQGFDHQITAVVEENLKEQIMKQVHAVLEQVNGLIENNPDLLMNALGITIKDLEERTVYV